MRLLDYLLGGLALLALPVLVWWGIYQSPQSAVNLQSRLEARAKAALTAAGADWANVELEGQRAVLTGDAPSRDAVTEAAGAVLRSNGPGGVIFGGVTMVESRVDAAQPISPYVWRAQKTADGRIVLSGYVPSKSIQANLVEEARLVGRAAVDDEMKLAAGAPAGNFQGIARLALAELAKLEQGEIVLKDHKVVLRGEVSDPAERARIIAAISGLAAPFRGEPMLAGDVRWRAVLADTGLTLSGRVGSEADRRRLLEVARGAYAGDVTDEMEIGAMPGEGWLAGALAGLPEFARFRSGEMAFDAAGGLFMFDGEASASTLYYLREDMTRSAGGWKVVVGAEVITGAPAPEGGQGAVLVPASVTASPDELACGPALEAALSSGGVMFTTDGSLDRQSGPLLDQIAGIALSCDPSVRFEIEAPSQVQASELTDFMVAAGVPRARLAAIRSGPDTGGTANQSEEVGTALPARVRIRVLERSKE